MINYKTIADLNHDVKRLIPKLPPVDLLVGVPRDGLMAALMMAFIMNVPVTDVEGLMARRLLGTGHRFAERNQVDFVNARILVVDDSIASGKSIAQVKTVAGAKATYLVFYTGQKHVAEADIVYQVLEEPRIFEWNLADSFYLKHACVDMDGVLCRDPSKTEQEDEAKYQAFMANTQPYMRPYREILRIVTAREEKYRPVTESWLSSHHVKYKALAMRPNGDIGHSAFKAREYQRNGQAKLFIENVPGQAQRIFDHTHKPVLCLKTNQILQEGA